MSFVSLFLMTVFFNARNSTNRRELWGGVSVGRLNAMEGKVMQMASLGGGIYGGFVLGSSGQGALLGTPWPPIFATSPGGVLQSSMAAQWRIALLLAGVRRLHNQATDVLLRAAPYAIGGVAAFWTIERLVTSFSRIT